MFPRWLISFTALWFVIGTIASAQDRATVQLRDGSRFEGRIEEMTASELFVRVSLHDQRRVPVSSVVLIDRVGGGSGLPDTELREAAGAQHLLMMQNGSSLKGQLVAIRGGEGSADPTEARTYVFRTGDGAQRTLTPDQVSRIYLGNYPVANATGTVPVPGVSDLSPGDNVPGSIRVPATGGWVTTGMRVRKGELVYFSASGEVQLSDNRNDRARTPGTPRMAPGAPMPTVNAGALIGRVGNSQPFAIGDQASVPMPFDGVLFLAVNDDERGDNVGEFFVTVSRRR